MKQHGHNDVVFFVILLYIPCLGLVQIKKKCMLDVNLKQLPQLRGKVIAQGPSDAIENNREVIEAYLGADY